MSPREDETFEVDPHEFDKERRKKRIKGKFRDKTRKTWEVDPVQKVHGPKKKSKGSDRRQSRRDMRDMMKDY